MTVVVEAGATKSDWRILDGGTQRRLLLPGINVSTIAMERNLQTLSDGLDALGASSLDGLFLYTAGIVTDDVRRRVEAFVRGRISVGQFDIQDDLVAAARAVCGRSSGIVAILGTGSNACSWDGEKVSFRVRSGGFIIGDDGGGAALGRQFLADFIKNLVPEEIAAGFSRDFDASYEAIVAGVYRSEAPAGYLGSFAPWLLERVGNPYVKSLIENNFRAFIERSLKRYDVSSYPVGVVGGWGYACREMFTRLCAEQGIRTGVFLPAPVEGLAEYHSGS